MAVLPQQTCHALERERLQSDPFDRAVADQRREHLSQRIVDGQPVVSERHHEEAGGLRHAPSEQRDEIE